jgi:hypothetical protein
MKLIQSIKLILLIVIAFLPISVEIPDFTIGEHNRFNFYKSTEGQIKLKVELKHIQIMKVQQNPKSFTVRVTGIGDPIKVGIDGCEYKNINNDDFKSYFFINDTVEDLKKEVQKLELKNDNFDQRIARITEQQTLDSNRYSEAKYNASFHSNLGDLMNEYRVTNLESSEPNYKSELLALNKDKEHNDVELRNAKNRLESNTADIRTYTKKIVTYTNREGVKITFKDSEFGINESDGAFIKYERIFNEITIQKQNTIKIDEAENFTLTDGAVTQILELRELLTANGFELKGDVYRKQSKKKRHLKNK